MVVLLLPHLVLVVVILVVIVLGIAQGGSLAAADGCQAAYQDSTEDQSGRNSSNPARIRLNA